MADRARSSGETALATRSTSAAGRGITAWRHASGSIATSERDPNVATLSIAAGAAHPRGVAAAPILLLASIVLGTVRRSIRRPVHCPLGRVWHIRHALLAGGGPRRVQRRSGSIALGGGQ